METMYDRIKHMTLGEMKNFIYWVYLCGNRDGRNCLEDEPEISYFGGQMLLKPASEIMPNNSVEDLWDNFEAIYGR